MSFYLTKVCKICVIGDTKTNCYGSDPKIYEIAGYLSNIDNDITNDFCIVDTETNIDK